MGEAGNVIQPDVLADARLFDNQIFNALSRQHFACRAGHCFPITKRKVQYPIARTGELKIIVIITVNGLILFYS